MRDVEDSYRTLEVAAVAVASGHRSDQICNGALSAHSSSKNLASVLLLSFSVLWHIEVSLTAFGHRRRMSGNQGGFRVYHKLLVGSSFYLHVPACFPEAPPRSGWGSGVQSLREQVYMENHDLALPT